MEAAGDEGLGVRRISGAWPVMLGVFIVVLGGLAWYVSNIPVRYSSNSVVAFQPQPGRSDGRDLISLLIQTYPEYVVSQAAVDRAAQASGVSPADVRSGLDAQIPPLTLNMTIRTELSDPRQAQVANQSLVDQVLERAKDDQFLVAEAVSDADVSDSPAGLSKRLLYAVSLVLALGSALVAGVIAARWFVSPRSSASIDRTSAS